MTKRLLTFLLCILFVLSALAGCAESDSNVNSGQTTLAEITTELSQETEVLEWVPFKTYSLQEDVPVKNIILIIGDGMGEEIINAVEIVKKENPLILASKNIDAHKFLPTGLPYQGYVTTDSLSGVTDSAAAATAMSCGIKTKNEYLGADKKGEAVETIIEFAMARGMKTGIAVTQIVPHATPAGMFAHATLRSNYSLLMRQELAAEIDVIFGGGAAHLSGKAERLVETNNYQYISDPADLDKLTADKKALGLFASDNKLAEDAPSLATLSLKALELLDNENGFFLMIEGSDIDSFEHMNDMESTLTEMMVFEQAFDIAMTWAQNHPGTLVITTADHETGGIALPENATAKDINNNCFTTDGHTGVNVKVFAAGAQSGAFFKNGETIDNTDIAKFMRRVLNETYGEAPVQLKNRVDFEGLEE